MTPCLPILLLLAAGPAPEGPLPDVLVWEVKAIGVPEDLRAMLQLSLPHQVAQVPGLHVVSAKDLSAAMDVQYQKRLLGCTDEACIGEISGALGIRHVLFSELVAVERNLLMSMRLMDMASMRVVSTASLQCATSPEAAISTSADLVKRVFFPDAGGRPWAKVGFIAGGAFGVATVVLAVLWRAAVVDYRESILPEESSSRRAQNLGGLTLAGGGLTLLGLAAGTYLQLRYDGKPLALERQNQGVAP